MQSVIYMYGRGDRKRCVPWGAIKIFHRTFSRMCRKMISKRFVVWSFVRADINTAGHAL